MNILIITDVLWRNNNGVGNSYSNIFSNMPDIKVANICCQEGKSDNNISSSCFQISEARLLMNLINKKIPTGVIESSRREVDGNSSKVKTRKYIRILMRTRLQLLFWIRNLIWKLGRWKSNELILFLDSFKPDLIFAQLQDKIYLNNIVEYIQDYVKCPLVLYVWDDVYSLKQFSLSPLFWIDRFHQRFSIRSLMKKCSKLYTISIEQEEEYKKTFGIETGLLYKGKNFYDKKIQCKNNKEKAVNMLYTGNLYSGRYNTLLKICKMIDDYNCNKKNSRIQLHIYSGTSLSNRQVLKLNRQSGCYFHGAVSEKEVSSFQENADILLHIEPVSLKGSLLCRLSFSTKLVDYFYKGKCIFAVGHKRCASMAYLRRNDAAIISTSLSDTKEKLIMLVENDRLIKEYAEKAWECGKRNHQISEIQKRLKLDFDTLTADAVDL